MKNECSASKYNFSMLWHKKPFKTSSLYSQLLLNLIVFLTDGTKAENKNKTKILLGAANRGFVQANHGCCPNNQCQDYGSCSLANKEASLLCPQVPPCPRFHIEIIDLLMQLDLHAGVDVEVNL